MIQARLLCNLFDGMVAVARGIASPVGELFNDFPDRISDTAIIIGLSSAAGNESHALYAGLIASLLAMTTAYVRLLGKTAGAHQDFSGPMAKQHRMFVITALCVMCASVAPSGRLPATLIPKGVSVPIASLLTSLPTLLLYIISVGCVLTVFNRLRKIVAVLHLPKQH